MTRLSLTVSSALLLFVGSCQSLSSPFGPTAKNVATQILQGAGPAEVDLNQYNLGSLEEMEKEWTAQFVQKQGEKEQMVVLGVKSDQELFVDTVQVSFPRVPGGGLGLELAELAGGRDDGLGITLITAVIPGGPSDGTDIFPGDSIAEVSIKRTKVRASKEAGVLQEKEEQWSVPTECLSYDATVQAIQSLPPVLDGYQDEFILKLKRLRRKPKVTVKLQYPPSQDEPDEEITMFAGENLRLGMLLRGVKLNDPLAQRFDTKTGGNCGAGGLCRTCSVAVQTGGDLLNPQRPAEKQMLEDNPRWRLACKAIVGYGMKEGELKIRVNPRQW